MPFVLGPPYVLQLAYLGLFNVTRWQSDDMATAQLLVEGAKEIFAACVLWSLAWSSAVARTFLGAARGYCSPSDYADDFNHVALGGWTPCLATCVFTSIPIVLLIVFVTFKTLGRRLVKNDTPSDSFGWPLLVRLTTIVALGLLAIVRYSSLKDVSSTDDTKVYSLWEATDATLFISAWELFVCSVICRDVTTFLRKWTPMTRQIWFPPILAVGLAIADLMRLTIITVMFKGSPTQALAVVPNFDARYLCGITLQTYIIAIAIMCGNASARDIVYANAGVKSPLLG